MPLQQFGLAPDWIHRDFGDEGGVLYHPYAGDLLAIDPVASEVLTHLRKGRASGEECIAATILAYPDEDARALRESANAHLTELLELGVLTELAAAEC